MTLCHTLTCQVLFLVGGRQRRPLARRLVGLGLVESWQETSWAPGPVGLGLGRRGLLGRSLLGRGLLDGGALLRGLLRGRLLGGHATETHFL